MYPHGSLSASHLWQPAELARRVLGQRPTAVPPTRDLWPPEPRPLSISTLHIAYLQEEPLPRRAVTLPPQGYALAPAFEPSFPRVSDGVHCCTVGTNTDSQPTMLDRIRAVFSRKHTDTSTKTHDRLFSSHGAVTVESEIGGANVAQRALGGIKKIISGAKYRITPGSEVVDSPKIVYDTSKPGERMRSAFGAREERKCWELPSRTKCCRGLRALGGRCARRPRAHPRVRSPSPHLQITQLCALRMRRRGKRRAAGVRRGGRRGRASSPAPPGPPAARPQPRRPGRSVSRPPLYCHLSHPSLLIGGLLRKLCKLNFQV
ncbi:hypothetical protein EVAR_11919_1 [Eumeta japonica]|uniref:Uncharacterized protein n=1 Tax=Eumeta variegata TaxID=151549 RepID=A0A4C1U7L7_EUMVA|nr:hypothetical protein EVAR_11919_1 [Eumeta japonica]